jgi:transcriptional regulator GlxA family with amidase domain
MLSPTSPALLGVLIYEGVEPIDLGGTVGVVSMARRVLPNVQSTVIARQAGPVRLAGGLTVHADHGIASAPPCDVVIVCGGPGWPEAAADPALLGFLRGLPPERVVSVCTGALILAAAGLLDGRTATTRRHAVSRETVAPLDRLAGLVAAKAGGGTIQPRVAAVVDDTVVTGGGVSLAIDTTLYLLGRLYGAAAAAEIAQVLEYDRAWAANRDALGVVIAPP